MSVADKKVLLNRISEILGESLTAAEVGSVMRSVSESFEKYSVDLAPAQSPENAPDDLMDAFLTAKEVEGRSPKTVERYRYVIDRLRTSVNVPLSRVNVYHIRKYLMEEKENGSSDRTVEGYRSVLSSFFGWLHREGLLPKNPMGNIGPVRFEKKVRSPLSEVDLELLREVCASEKGNGPKCTGVRDKAVVAFLLATGCRVSEVCALDRDSVDLAAGECTVHGKGNKERVVFLDEVSVMLLKRYLDGREDESPALFVGKRSDRLTPGGIRYLLKSLEKRAGVENVHPHRFRRTLATNLAARGMPIQEVAHILGHDRIDTTMKYVCVSRTSVKNAYHKFA